MRLHKTEVARIKILHITDALNGGILTALNNLTQNQQICDHYVLWDSHSDTPVPEISELNFRNSRMTGGHFSKILTINKLVKSMNPDVIHLHSSLAGLYGRIIPKRKPVCYSAHAFAFERKDISRLKAMIFRIIESALQVSTHTNILFWPIEQQHIRKLFMRKKIVMTDALWSNLLTSIRKAKYSQSENKNELVVIGRVAAAKDPKFVIKVFEELTKRNLGIRIKWVGARDNDEIDRLRKDGIEGILWTNSRKDLGEHISKSRATLITSKWEVGPYTFYESVSLGRNVVAKDVESIKLLGINCHSTVADFCNEIELLSNDLFAELHFNKQKECVLNYYKEARYENIEALYEKISKNRAEKSEF